MFRRPPTSLRSVVRTRPVHSCRRPLSSHVAPTTSLKASWQRGALITLLSVAGVAAFFQTRNKVLLDSQAPTSPVAGTEPTPIRTDPATGIEFPETLVIPSRVRLPPFQLVGLGVRTVSFLGIKVYSVAFYADLTNLKIPENLNPDEKIDYIISNTACVIRIIPTRNTSYSHLRDGFMRALQARMTNQLKDGSISTQEAEDAQSPLRKLKSAFPSSPLRKGEPLDILLLSPPKNPSEKRALVIRDLGSIESNWVSKQFVSVYFVGDGISPPMKKTVVEFLQDSPAKLTN